MGEFVDAVWRLERAVAAAREVDSQLPSQCLHVLLVVAAKPGVSQSDIAALTGLAGSSVSRNVSSLGALHRNGSQGYGLISQVPHPVDDRASTLYLTTKGRDTVRKLLQAVTGKPADAFIPRVVR